MALAGISKRAASDPDGAALVDDTGALTWTEVEAQVGAVAAAMRDVVGDTNARVAVLGENRAETVIAHAAGILAGVGTVAMSRQLKAGEMAAQMKDAGCVAAVTGPLALPAVQEAAATVGLTTVVVAGADATSPATGWSAWAHSGRTLSVGDRPVHPPLVYTSGTTGRARGTEVRWAPRTASTVEAFVAAIASPSSFPDGPHLVVGPLQHNAPLTSIRHLLAGQPVVVMGKFDAENALRLVERHRVTSTVMVPTHFQRLLALPGQVRACYDVSSLVSVYHTGAACPPDVKRAMIDWFGPVLTETYGGSEIGTVCRITSTEWLEHPGSVGRVVAPFEVVVLDENRRPLPPGEVGLLGFRTPPDRSVSYHADPDKTQSAHIAPGVVTLGDVGYVTDDGYIYITDRIADMVVSGGVNLYPAESETVLARHPAVAEVAVIGVPDADLGEALKALVVPAGEPPEPAELDAHCRRHLAAYKCPKSYDFVPALERNAMGKLDKRALRKPYWQGDRTIAG